MKKPIIFSGIQATGMPHLGNFLGAIRHWERLSADYQCLYCVVDLHSITVRQNPENLRKSGREMLAWLIALGLNPATNTLYFQSQVPAHAELSWILNCFTYMGELNRMTQFKSKSAKNDENINAGLFTYPVLMAADIILFDSDVVPVGKDQVQHIEMAQDIAQSVNANYGQTVLKIPRAGVQENAAIVPGLDGRKMSKSYGNTIPLFSPEKTLRKTIMRVVTNSQAVEEPKDPETSQIFLLYKLFATAEEQAALAARYRAGGMGWGEAKEELFRAANRELAPMRERYDAIMADIPALDRILEQGAEKARPIAAATVQRFRKAAGID